MNSRPDKDPEGEGPADESIKAVLSGLASRSFAVIPDFLDRDTVSSLRAELLAFDAAGALRPAGIGRDAAFHAGIRNDRILWVDDATASPAQRTALSRLDALRLSINRNLFIGLRDLECHLALYAPGGRYDKHLDAFRGRSQRKVSIVLYLNPDWTADDGGRLRLYEAGTDDRVATEVAPEAGTLAVFLSEEVWHEVLPTRRDRLTLTGWFRS